MLLLVPETPAPSSQTLVTHLWLTTNPCTLGQGILIPRGLAGTPLYQSPRTPRGRAAGEGFALALGLPVLCGGPGCPRRSSGCLQGYTAPTSGSHS